MIEEMVRILRLTCEVTSLTTVRKWIEGRGYTITDYKIWWGKFGGYVTFWYIKG